jgi:hypothetical protein
MENWEVRLDAELEKWENDSDFDSSTVDVFKKFYASEKQRVVEKVRGAMPDIGIMAAMSMSTEAVEYVNGYDKCKADVLSILETK